MELYDGCWYDCSDPLNKEKYEDWDYSNSHQFCEVCAKKSECPASIHGSDLRIKRKPGGVRKKDPDGPPLHHWYSVDDDHICPNHPKNQLHPPHAFKNRPEH